VRRSSNERFGVNGVGLIYERAGTGEIERGARENFFASGKGR